LKEVAFAFHPPEEKDKKRIRKRKEKMKAVGKGNERLSCSDVVVLVEQLGELVKLRMVHNHFEPFSDGWGG